MIHGCRLDATIDCDSGLCVFLARFGHYPGAVVPVSSFEEILVEIYDDLIDSIISAILADLKF